MGSYRARKTKIVVIVEVPVAHDCTRCWWIDLPSSKANLQSYCRLFSIRLEAGTKYYTKPCEECMVARALVKEERRKAKNEAIKKSNS